MKKKTYILTFLMMLCSFAFGQATYHWEKPDGWQHNMVIYGNVTINGIAPDSNLDLELGAFCGNELRGREKVSRINDNKELIVYGAEGHAITFKLYDCTNNRMLDEYECSVKETFKEGEFVVGKTFNFTSKNHWNPSHNTNSNMTITAHVTINGVDVAGDYEIGAFIGDNVCGSARVNNSIAYIVISANVDDLGNPINGTNNVTFKLWNHGANPAGLTKEITDVTVNYEHNATYGSQENPFVINFNEAVAEVAGEKFATLQAAVNATTATNTEVNVLRDFALDNTVTIANNQTVVLNLNGKTISQEKACTASYSMINNKGNLTITGNGKLSFKDTGAGDSNFGWGSYTISNNGTLVVENGTIEHLGTQTFATHCIMAIYQYSGSTTINGGTISTPNYRSARLWKGNMTINGGTFDGQVWVQAVDDSANLTINGGIFEPNGGDASAVFVTNNQYKVELNVTAGTFNGKIGTSDANKEGVKGSISGGTFSATAKNETNEALLAEGYIFEENTDGTYSVVPGLKGEGTKENPFIIMNIDDLVFFRNHVNGGGTKYNADGVYVALGADIDMTGVNWSVNIGDDANATFDGIFDGKNHTISNLNSAETAQKADGYICTGLFGAIAGNAVVKNFTIENVTINTGDFTGNNVAAVVGFAYNAKGSIENVHVTGNININAPKATGVGAILGYDYYSPTLKVEECSVKGADNNNSVILGKSYVGGVVGYASSKIALNENTVENVSVTGTASVGAIAGIMLAGSSADKNTVKNVALSATGELWANSAAVVAGTITSGGVTVANTTVENVTANNAAASIVGGVLVEKPTTPIVKVPAKNENVYYTTHIAALSAQGDNVTFFVPYTVEAGETLTIDKNVTYTSNVLGEAMITNKGTLTITGSVDYKYTGAADATYSKGNYTINNSGTLTVNGNVENKTAEMSHASYAINTNAGATLNVESGNVLNLNGHAIRMVSFGTAENNVNINGGYIEGTRALQVQLPGGENAAAPEMKVNIDGGELKSNEETYNLAVYVYSNGQSAENFELAISGGTFNGNVAINAKASETMQNNAVVVTDGVFNGQYGVFSYSEATDAVNKIAIEGGDFATNYSEKYAEDNGYIFIKNAQGTYTVTLGKYAAKIDDTRYATLAAAVKAATNGQTITLLRDINENVTIEDKKLTLDGAGFNSTGTIYTDVTTAYPLTFQNFNIKETASYFVKVIGGGGNYYFNNCNIINSDYGLFYANSSTHIVSIKESTIVGCDYAVNFTSCNTVTLEKVTMTDCGYGIFTQNKGVRTFNVRECNIEAEYPICVYVTGTALQTFNFEGENTLTGEVDLGNYGKLVLKKATSTLAAEEGLVVTTPVEGCTVTYQNGVYSVVPANVKNSNTGKMYGTIQEAIDDAASGNTLVLLEDVTVNVNDEAMSTLPALPDFSNYPSCFVVTGKNITIDLAGKTITANVTTTKNFMAVFSAGNGGNLTLIDSADEDGTVEMIVADNAKVYSLITNMDATSNITIKDGNYICNQIVGWGQSLIYDAQGRMLIEGGNFYLGNVGQAVPYNNGLPWIFNTYSNCTNSITITGGTYNYDINHQHWAHEVYVPETLALKDNENGTWTVVGAEAYVVEFVTSCSKTRNVGYATLEKAFAVAMEKDREDVVLVKDVELENTLTVNAGEQIVLDLNGKVVSDTCNAAQSHMIMVQNTADLTIKDSSNPSTGKLTYAQGTSNIGWAIDLEGNLTLESGTIELTGDSWSIGYAVDVRPNSWGSEYTEGTTFTMNDGKLVSSDGAVRVASSSAAAHENVSASFVMNKGTIDAAGDGVFVQQSDAIYDVLSFTMYGGTIESDLNPVRVYGPAATDYVNGQNRMNINFFGGDMNYTGTETREWIIENVLRVGGGSSIETILESGNITAIEAFAQNNELPEGYAWADNNDGTFSAISVVAKIGNNYYSTLQDAVNAAQYGDEITVIKDFTVTTTVVVDETVSIDLNGKTITGSQVLPVIRIKNGATATVKNGNITNNDGYIFILGESGSTTSGNLTIEGGKYHGATSVASVTCGTLTVNGGEFSVEPYQGSYAYLINCIDANYSNKTAKVVVKGGIFHNWNPENNAAEGEGTNFCDASYYALEVETGLFFVLPKTEITQSTSLDAGWNWFSLYVDLNGEAGLGMLRNSLTNGLNIKNQDDFTNYDANEQQWYGSLFSVKVNDMYMINVGSAQTIELNAYQVNPADYEFTLNSNWTWIGYPSMYALPISTALNGFTPTVGDRIKSQDAFAEYTENDGWQGSLMIMEPGEGFMYFNKSGEKTLVYSATNGYRGEAPAANITAANNLMVPNMSKYANNMNITAVVNIDGEELMTEDFEVAVFAGEELRGSARPIYIESLNRYMLFITVYGEESEELTFKYYDLNSGEELNLFADSKVVFEVNSVIGSVEQPSVLSYGTLSIDETSASSFNIYPNPTTRDRAINLQATCDNVEVFNALGVKVAEYQNVDTIDALETAGVYVIRVTINGEVKNCRLVVK